MARLRRLPRKFGTATILPAKRPPVSSRSRNNYEITRNCYFGGMARSCFRFGSFFLDAQKGVLLSRREPVSIGRRGLAILEMLLLNAGEVVSKAALLDAAWPGIAIEESNLSVQIAALRKALGPSSDNNETWIATVQRLGYRFIGDVERVQGDESTDNIHLAGRLPREPSISVLPFANLSGDPEQDYFADGLAEDIATSLSRLRWLVVAARNSSFSYKARSADALLVGKELGVRYVLNERRSCP
jgi:DNA-binding winged helix-turn-helix (wHTH) protein